MKKALEKNFKSTNENRKSEFEDKNPEIVQLEKNKEKNKKGKESLHDLWESIKRTNRIIDILGEV